MSDTIPVRVTVLQAWDEVTLTVPDQMTVHELKRRALDAVRVVDNPAAFMVKFRGAELPNEERTLAQEQVPAGGALIVLRRRRRAVR
ncbi:MAG: hypothetical protein ABJC19_04130 [Gemmatimonadota bacterium]